MKPMQEAQTVVGGVRMEILLLMKKGSIFLKQAAEKDFLLTREIINGLKRHLRDLFQSQTRLEDFNYSDLYK
jgi:hypothetical protein